MTIGARLKFIRSGLPHLAMARSLGISLRAYAIYERDERLPRADTLIRLNDLGWNTNWVLTGIGEKGLDTRSSSPPHNLGIDELKAAVRVAEEALDESRLGPDDYAMLVGLIYVALGKGLDIADVLAFANACRPRAAWSRNARSQSERLNRSVDRFVREHHGIPE
ncbi:helix-turn-helix transcriptional regulator [Dyella sp. 333MFSha]|uniref:helix-turn-helix domain-containing protein n=1 Tax=Dyella sp. 333MFSha TaxID=1798240 RepID=UPI00089054FB|nr:helix-turn-helix transcriptional regulator [Dyella sp. 333MFSha]SDG88817.1 hypothetical protein SAMN04515659_3736 [Dyella sp. 333MFSha]